MIHSRISIEKPYSLSSEGIGEYLKELRQAEKIIEKNDFDFERAGLCSTEKVKETLEAIKQQIKLCEFYFFTKKRKDLFKWIFTENSTGHNSYGEKRNIWTYSNGKVNIWTYSNGKVKAVIEIFNREKSTEIVSKVVSDCELYIYFHAGETYKTLRSVESIKSYILDVKVRLEKEISEAEYNKQEQRFYDFILNCGGVA
jgi:hypothetical protein